MHFGQWAAASPEPEPGLTDTLMFSPGAEKAMGRRVSFESLLGWVQEDAAGLAAQAPKPRARLRLRGSSVVAIAWTSSETIQKRGG